MNNHCLIDDAVAHGDFIALALHGNDVVICDLSH